MRDEKYKYKNLNSVCSSLNAPAGSRITMKKISYLLVIVLLLICRTELFAADNLSTHRAYKVTSYNLGAIQDFTRDGVPNPAGKPLLITGEAADIFNSEHIGVVSPDETSSHSSDINSIVLSAQFDATKKISLQGAFGVTRNLWSPDFIDGLSGSSWEANLGVIYRLLDNLSYELHFGYMDTGDLFTDRSSYSDEENIIMVSNKLTLSF